MIVRTGFVAAFLLANACAPALAACPSEGGEAAEVAAVEPGLELRLADGRLVRLVGIDPASATSGDANLAESARSQLASIVAGRSVSLRLLDRTPDRWGRLTALAFAKVGAGGLAGSAIAAGLARFNAETAAHACRDAFLAAEATARSSKLGLWRDPSYAVLAFDDRTGFEQRSATFVLAEGRLTGVDTGAYRTKLRFATHDRKGRDALAATILPRTMKLFDKQGVTFSSLIGRNLRLRGRLDLRFGPELELTGPDAVEILPADAAAPLPAAPAAAGHG